MRAWVRPIPEEADDVDNLVLCPCGHSLANHDYAGCSNRQRTCGCARDRHAALEAAVDSARTSPVFGGYAVSRGDDAA